jgi:hypothetical protein
VEGRLRGLGEHDQLIQALHGGTIASPVDVVGAVEAITTAAVPEGIETEPQLVWDWSEFDWNFGDLLGLGNLLEMR